MTSSQFDCKSTPSVIASSMMCVITGLFLQQELNSLRTLHASLLALKEMVKAVNKVCSQCVVCVMHDKMTVGDAPKTLRGLAWYPARRGYQGS